MWFTYFFKGVCPPQWTWERRTDRHVKFNPSDCSICPQLSCNGRKCSEADSVPAARPLSLGVCCVMCACVSCSTRKCHQPWLCVIHTDEFHCSLSPLIVRANKPVKRAAARGWGVAGLTEESPLSKVWFLFQGDLNWESGGSIWQKHRLLGPCKLHTFFQTGAEARSTCGQSRWSCLICCEYLGTGVQVAPSRPAGSDTSSPCLVVQKKPERRGLMLIIITATDQPPTAGWEGKRGGLGCSCDPHCPLPLPPLSPSTSFSCYVFGLFPERPKSLSCVGSLIVFVLVSRQIEPGLLQKKMAKPNWSYCPEEWPGLKSQWLENYSAAPQILSELGPDIFSVVCLALILKSMYDSLKYLFLSFWLLLNFRPRLHAQRFYIVNNLALVDLLI